MWVVCGCPKHDLRLFSVPIWVHINAAVAIKFLIQFNYPSRGRLSQLIRQLLVSGSGGACASLWPVCRKRPRCRYRHICGFTIAGESGGALSRSHRRGNDASPFPYWGIYSRRPLGPWPHPVSIAFSRPIRRSSSSAFLCLVSHSPQFFHFPFSFFIWVAHLDNRCNHASLIEIIDPSIYWLVHPLVHRMRDDRIIQ